MNTAAITQVTFIRSSTILIINVSVYTAHNVLECFGAFALLNINYLVLHLITLLNIIKINLSLQQIQSKK